MIDTKKEEVPHFFPDGVEVTWRDEFHDDGSASSKALSFSFYGTTFSRKKFMSVYGRATVHEMELRREKFLKKPEGVNEADEYGDYLYHQQKDC